VAHPAERDFDDDLSRLQRRKFELDQFERTAGFNEDGG